MSIKLKILGLALIAFAATSAFAALNASATVAGHFVHDGAGENAIITAHEAKNTTHFLTFKHLEPGTHKVDPNAEPIECETASYQGKVTEKKVQVIRLYPTYTKCNTKGQATDTVKVTPEGCSFTFFSHGANTHGTVGVDCPAGKAIEVHHPNCTITIPAQTTAATLTEGITYTAKEEGKPSLTADVTVNTITGFYHGGICIFLGTNQKFRMDGSVTVKGYEYVSGKPEEHNLVEGAQIGITHT